MKAIVKEWKEGDSRHHYTTGEEIEVTKELPQFAIDCLGGPFMVEIFQKVDPFYFRTNKAGLTQMLKETQVELVG